MKRFFADPRRLAASAAFFLLLVSFLFYFLGPFRLVRRVFLFPSLSGTEVRGEERYLPRRVGAEENMELYAREVLLGPARIDALRLVPEGTRIHSLLYREGILYLDFSPNLILRKDTVPLPMDGILDLLSEGIRFNFPSVRRVVPSVGGTPLKTAGGD